MADIQTLKKLLAEEYGMPGRQADIRRGHEYYHYMIGGRLYAGTFVGRDSG